MTNEPDDVFAKVRNKLAASMARIAADPGPPMASDKAQDEFLELVIYGNEVPAVADFLHKFYDSGTPVISCRFDVLVAGGAVGEVFRYDFAEPLKKALFACRAGYFVNRDGQWLNSHGESFEMANVEAKRRPACGSSALSDQL